MKNISQNDKNALNKQTILLLSVFPILNETYLNKQYKISKIFVYSISAEININNYLLNRDRLSLVKRIVHYAENS